MSWPVGTPCRVDGYEHTAFRVVGPPRRYPLAGNTAVLYSVRSVDGEKDFYAYEDELAPLAEDEFCECGTIGCPVGTADRVGDLMTVALVMLEAHSKQRQAEHDTPQPDTLTAETASEAAAEVTRRVLGESWWEPWVTRER